RDRDLDAGPDKRQPPGATSTSRRKDGQLPFHRHEHAIRSFGKDIGGLRIGPVLVIRKTLCKRARPVLRRVVRTERVVTAFESGDRRESFSGCLLLLTLY